MEAKWQDKQRWGKITQGIRQNKNHLPHTQCNTAREAVVQEGKERPFTLGGCKHCWKLNKFSASMSTTEGGRCQKWLCPGEGSTQQNITEGNEVAPEFMPSHKCQQQHFPTAINSIKWWLEMGHPALLQVWWTNGRDPAWVQMWNQLVSALKEKIIFTFLYTTGSVGQNLLILFIFWKWQGCTWKEMQCWKGLPASPRGSMDSASHPLTLQPVKVPGNA